MSPDSSSPTLPFVFGVFDSISAAACKPSEVFPVFTDTYPVVVVGVTNTVAESLNNANTTKGNALFIVCSELEPSPSAVNETLTNINICGATSQCGGCSTIVVRFGKNFYWVCGPLVPGLFETHPKFGEDVTTQMKNALDRISKGEHINVPWPTVIPSQKVFYQGELHQAEDMITKIPEMTLDEILDMLFQLRFACNTQQIEALKKLMVKFVEEVMMKDVNKYKDAMKKLCSSLLKNGKSLSESKLYRKAKDNYHKARKEVSRKVTILLDAVNGMHGNEYAPLMVSFRGSGKVGNSLRRAKIEKNVKDASGASIEELCEICEEFADEKSGGGLFV